MTPSMRAVGILSSLWPITLLSSPTVSVTSAPAAKITGPPPVLSVVTKS